MFANTFLIPRKKYKNKKEKFFNEDDSKDEVEEDLSL